MLSEPIYLEDQRAVLSVVDLESPAATTRTIKDQRNQSREYWQWGTDNQRPKKMINAVEKNILLPEIIDFKKRAITSGGLIYGTEEVTNKGRIINPIVVPEIDEWCERSGVAAWLDETTEDKETFGNRATEYLLNMRREIVGIQAVDASEVRLEKQQLSGRNAGRIMNCYVSANWDKSAPPDLQIVPALDPLFDVKGQIQDGSKYKYMLFSRHLTRGQKYYRRSPIEALIDSAWLDVHNAYPKWKLSAMNKNLAIGYHIQINEAWLRWKYRDWEEIKDSERDERKKKLGREFMEMMQGEDKAGSPLISTFKQENGQEIVGWKIEPITNKNFGENSFLDDITHSNMMICFSQGVDPSSIGLSGKIGQGAGSGSDKRVAINQYLQMHAADQREILRPLQIVADCNGWSKYTSGKRLVFGLLNFQVATLDSGTETTSTQTTEVE